MQCKVPDDITSYLDTDHDQQATVALLTWYMSLHKHTSEGNKNPACLGKLEGFEEDQPA